jgi:hypothetical protein
MMDTPPKLTENGLCRSNSLAHYDAGFTERPSHHPQIWNFKSHPKVPVFLKESRIILAKKVGG